MGVYGGGLTETFVQYGRLHATKKRNPSLRFGCPPYTVLVEVGGGGKKTLRVRLVTLWFGAIFLRFLLMLLQYM